MVNKLITGKKRWLTLLILFMLAFPFITGQSGSLMTLFIMICIYAITAMALNLLIGYGGQISVGHAGFLSVGGYSAAILSAKLGLPFIVTLPLAGVITAVIGFFYRPSSGSIKRAFSCRHHIGIWNIDPTDCLELG